MILMWSNIILLQASIRHSSHWFEGKIDSWQKGVLLWIWAVFKQPGLLLISSILAYGAELNPYNFFIVFNVFLWIAHSQPLFLYFRLFWIAIDRYVWDNLLPMSGFEPRMSGAGSDCSANCATTTALFLYSMLTKHFVGILRHNYLSFIMTMTKSNR